MESRIFAGFLFYTNWLNPEEFFCTAKKTKMTQPRKFLVILLVITLSSCASIVSKSNWPFSIDTSPDHADVSITNKKGVEVFHGKTPAAMKLKSGSGFFGKESYIVTLSMQGYETKKVSLECKLNGWYFGNILIGGIIGLLIVDPATGAMYRLETEGLHEDLDPSPKSTLNIINLKDVPDSLKTSLVRLP